MGEEEEAMAVEDMEGEEKDIKKNELNHIVCGLGDIISSQQWGGEREIEREESYFSLMQS